MCHRKTEGVGPRYFVLVGARPEGSGAEVIAQRATRVAVVDFNTLAFGEEEPVAGQNTPAIGGGLPNTVLVCLLQKCSEKLSRRFGFVFRRALLRKRGQGNQRCSHEQRRKTFRSCHLNKLPIVWIESRWREPPSAPAWHEGMVTVHALYFAAVHSANPPISLDKFCGIV